MLSAPNRLRRRADFSGVLRDRRGVRVGSSLLVVHARRAVSRAGEPPRIGLVVSRAVGGAVVRNRTKRRVRGLLVQDIARLPTGIDVVVRANPAAGRASSMELAGSLGPLLDRVIRKIGGAA